MKKLLAVLPLCLLLAGCAKENTGLERAMALRTELLSGQSCSFLAEVTADYGDVLHSFSLSCQGDRRGDLTFTVTEPETLEGITGRVSDSGGKLTFQDTALQFDLLADGQLSPVSAPWILLRTLRSGYLLGAAQEEELLHVTARDSYDSDALLVDLWLGAGDRPIRGEILYGNRRILTVDLQEFQVEPSEN